METEAPPAAAAATVPGPASEPMKEKKVYVMPTLAVVIYDLAEKAVLKKEKESGCVLEKEARDKALKEEGKRLFALASLSKAMISEAFTLYIEKAAGTSSSVRQDAFKIVAHDQQNIFNILAIKASDVEFAFHQNVLRAAHFISMLYAIIDTGFVEDNQSKADALYDLYYIMSSVGHLKSYVTFYMKHMLSLYGKPYAKGYETLATFVNPRALEFRVDVKPADTEPPAIPAADAASVPEVSGKTEEGAVPVPENAQKTDEEAATVPENAPETAAPAAEAASDGDAVPEMPVAQDKAQVHETFKKPQTPEFETNDHQLHSLITQITSFVSMEIEAVEQRIKDGKQDIETDDEGKPVTAESVADAWTDAMLMLRETSEYYIMVLNAAEHIDLDLSLKADCAKNPIRIVKTLLEGHNNVATAIRLHLVPHAAECIFSGLLSCARIKPQPTLVQYLQEDSQRLRVRPVPKETSDAYPLAPGRKPLYAGKTYDNIKVLQEMSALLWRSPCSETMALFLNDAGVPPQKFIDASEAIASQTARAMRPNRRTRKANDKREAELKELLAHQARVKADRLRADEMQAERLKERAEAERAKAQQEAESVAQPARDTPQ